MKTAVVLTSGGLDSLLTIKLMEKTKIPFRVVHFDIGLTYDKPIVAGQRISKYFGLEDVVRNGIEIDKFDIAKEFYSYLLSIKDFSQYNSCLEYKVFMLKKAREYIKDALFIVTGDVLNQRPMIQGLDAIKYADNSIDVEVFRPLSAKLLPKSALLSDFPILSTISYDFEGFDKKRKTLAKELDIVYTEIVKESDQELDMGRKAFEIFEKQYINVASVNKIGMHFKLSDTARCVIGRTPFESNYLKNFYDKLGKKDFSFSLSKPRFLFGFVYGSKFPEEFEELALGIFSAVTLSDTVQLYDNEGLLLGNKKTIPIKDFIPYLLHPNNTPLCPLNVQK